MVSHNCPLFRACTKRLCGKRILLFTRGCRYREDVHIVRSAPDLEKFDQLQEELKDEIEEKDRIQVG
jgi:hypothetical protein